MRIIDRYLLLHELCSNALVGLAAAELRRVTLPWAVFQWKDLLAALAKNAINLCLLLLDLYNNAIVGSAANSRQVVLQQAMTQWRDRRLRLSTIACRLHK